MGIVDFHDLTLTIKKDDDETEVLNVKRLVDNVRRRPDRDVRHEKQAGGLLSNNQGDNLFIHHTNLEWLSLNWRKYRASQISISIPRLILRMFEEMLKRKLGYFPTLREVRDGIIGGQLQQLEQERHRWSNNARFKLLRR